MGGIGSLQDLFISNVDRYTTHKFHVHHVTSHSKYRLAYARQYFRRTTFETTYSTFQSGRSSHCFGSESDTKSSADALTPSSSLPSERPSLYRRRRPSLTTLYSRTILWWRTVNARAVRLKIESTLVTFWAWRALISRELSNAQIARSKSLFREGA